VEVAVAASVLVVATAAEQGLEAVVVEFVLAETHLF
jgi:hypothetical protein